LNRVGVSEGAVNTVPQAAIGFVAELRAKITAQEIKLAAMRSSMTEANPEFRLARLELSALRDQLGKVERNDHTKTDGPLAGYIGRLRDFKYAEALFDLMAKQYELARLDEAREAAIIQVVDPALPPELKSKPRKALIAVITTLATFVLTLLALFFRQALRDLASEPENARKLARIREMFRLRSA
jgi:tyrosine-protein kinase Etk/Wzc